MPTHGAELITVEQPTEGPSLNLPRRKSLPLSSQTQCHNSASRPPARRVCLEAFMCVNKCFSVKRFNNHLAGPPDRQDEGSALFFFLFKRCLLSDYNVLFQEQLSQVLVAAFVFPMSDHSGVVAIKQEGQLTHNERCQTQNREEKADVSYWIDTDMMVQYEEREALHGFICKGRCKTDQIKRNIDSVRLRLSVCAKREKGQKHDLGVHVRQKVSDCVRIVTGCQSMTK